MDDRIRHTEFKVQAGIDSQLTERAALGTGIAFGPIHAPEGQHASLLGDILAVDWK